MLAVILGQKIEIEANEIMVWIAFNILEAHNCYDFPTFLANEIKVNLSKMEKDNF